MSRFRDLMRYKKRINRWHFRISPDGEPAVFSDYFGYVNDYEMDWEGAYLGDIITDIEYKEVYFPDFKCYVNDQLVLPETIVNPGDVVRLERRRNKNKNKGFPSLNSAKVNICEIIDPCPKLENLNVVGLFKDCSFLTSVKEDLFINVVSDNFAGAFQSSAIEIIPDNLMPKYRIYAPSMFAKSNIVEIPNNLFDSCSNIGSLFYDCKNLQTVRKLSDKEDINSIVCTSAFNRCISLESIPQNTFEGIKIAVASQMFKGCSSLSSLPSEAFDFTDCTSFTHFCSYTPSLRQLPNDLFSTATKEGKVYMDFSFENSGVEYITAELFKNVKNLTSLRSAFYGCENLTSVEEGAFSENTKIENFSFTFSGCSLTEARKEMFDSCRDSLTTVASVFNSNNIVRVDDRIFADCPKLTHANGAFYANNSLGTAPNKMFENSGEEGKSFNFNRLFAYNYALQEVPLDVFKGIKANVTEVEEVFIGCWKLKEIKEWFNDYPNITSFKGCFEDVGNDLKYSLTLPTGLFANQLNATNFENVFKDASITVTPNIFDNNQNITNVKEAFHTGRSSGRAEGTAPALWTRSNITSFNNCFYRQVKLTNYASIPNNWKGL